jgi:glycosyltransferase involved in cell wall biosynthesis
MSAKIAVVIPCYRVRDQILDVLASIGPEVGSIYCVDDACPDGSGACVEQECTDRRVRVLRRDVNGGVGAATLTGYYAAVLEGADVIVKLDGDGQMDPSLILRFSEPILQGKSDYVKGNRFFELEDHQGMPRLRLFGNAVLSFLNKLSSGYWNIFDPTNGYTAIDGVVARRIFNRSISKRYFFESDMLFHLYLLRAVVTDMPMRARYGDERSSLRIRKILLPFLAQHARNAVRRIAIQYFLRDFSLASIEFVFGCLVFLFGTIFGLTEWGLSVASQEPATAGTVMLAALPIIVGIQLILNAVNYDIQNVPRQPIQSRLKGDERDGLNEPTFTTWEASRLAPASERPRHVSDNLPTGS